MTCHFAVYGHVAAVDAKSSTQITDPAITNPAITKSEITNPAITDIVDIYTNAKGLHRYLNDNTRQGLLSFDIVALLSQMLNITSKIKLESTNRVNRALESEKASCVFLRVKSAEREKNFYFSLPLDLLLAPRLFIHGDNGPIPRSFLNEHNEVASLSRYFQHGSDKPLLILAKQSLGDELDQKISQIAQDKKIEINANNLFKSAFKMFRMNRGHIITYPESSLDSFNPPIKTYSYSIAGIEPVFGGRIMCNRAEGVDRFLRLVNKELLTLYANAEYRDIYKKYASKDAINLIYDYIDDTLIPRAQLALK